MILANYFFKTLHKRKQFAVKPRPNDRNISTQRIASLLGATCCTRLATLLCRVTTLLDVDGSSLSQQHPTCHNTAQHSDQTRATGCAQQCCDMLR